MQSLQISQNQDNEDEVILQQQEQSSITQKFKEFAQSTVVFYNNRKNQRKILLVFPIVFYFAILFLYYLCVFIVGMINPQCDFCIDLYVDPRDGYTKSVTDQSVYSQHTLKNGIRVLLIETPDNQDVGVALAIKGVGGYSDPEEYQGTSHFLEHLVFQGSDKYPKNKKEGDFLSFIFRNRGLPNGLTNLNYTLYPSVMPRQEMLEELVNRLSDFVDKPELSLEVMKKEIYAVDSEFYISNNEGPNALFNSIVFLADKSHPFHKKFYGTFQQLKHYQENPELLRQYHTQYYHPKRMYLTVQSHKSVQRKQILNLLENSFGNIQRENQNDEDISGKKENSNNINQSLNIFNNTMRGSIMYIQQKSNIHQAIFVFEVNAKNQAERQVWNFLNIQFQMKPVIQEKFKKFEKVLSCELGLEWLTQHQGLFIFQLNYIFQSQSFQEYMHIVEETFKSIQQSLGSFIKDGMDPSNIQNHKEYLKTAFKYKLNQNSFSEIMQISTLFLNNQDKDFLFTDFKINEKLITQEEIRRNIMYLMNPENMITIIRSNQFQNKVDSFTPVTNIPFKIEKSFLNELKYQNFTQFEPENKTTLQKILDGDYQQQASQNQTSFSTPLPVFILGKPKMEKGFKSFTENKAKFVKTKNNNNLFVYTDTKYDSPMELVYLLFEFHKKTNETEIDDSFIPIYNQIMFYYLEKQLPKMSKITQYGIEIKIPGFTGRAAITGVIMDMIKEVFSNMEKDLGNQQKFKEVFTALYFMNQMKSEMMPLQWGFEKMQEVLVDKYYSTDSMITMLSNLIKSDKLEPYRQGLKSTLEKGGLRFDMLVSGNVDKRRAEGLFERLDLNLKKFTFEDQFHIQEYQLLNITNTKKYSFVYPIEYRGYDSHNEGIIHYYQFNEWFGIYHAKAFKIMEDYLQGLAFDYLRSELQMGYIVKVQIKQKGFIRGLIISVQGFRFDTEYMSRKIDDFVNSIEQRLMEAIPDDLNLNNVFKEKSQQKSYSLFLQTEYVWGGIQNRLHLYDHEQFSSEDSLEITKQDLIKIWKENYSTFTKLSFPIFNENKNFTYEILKYQKETNGKSNEWITPMINSKHLYKKKILNLKEYFYRENKSQDAGIEQNQENMTKIYFYDQPAYKFKSHFNNYTVTWVPYIESQGSPYVLNADDN